MDLIQKALISKKLDKLEEFGEGKLTIVKRKDGKIFSYLTENDEIEPEQAIIKAVGIVHLQEY